MAKPAQIEEVESQPDEKTSPPLFTPEQAERLVKAFEMIGAALKNMKDRMF